MTEPARSDQEVSGAGGKVDAFQWCSKWPDQLASVWVTGKDGTVRRAHPGEPGARHLISHAISVGGVLGRRAINATGRWSMDLDEICEASGLINVSNAIATAIV